jgi:translocation and assembly module TamB
MKWKTKRISELLFFGILLIFFGLSYWLLYTQNGLNWTLKQINQAAGNILEYGHVNGAWLTQMELEYLTIRTPPVDIVGRNLLIEISTKNLLSGTLEFETVQAQNLTIKLNLTPPDTEKPKQDQPAEFALPITLLVDSLQVDKFSFEQQDKQLFILENIVASDSKIKRQIKIGSIAARSPYGELTVNGSISPDIDGKLDLHTSFILMLDDTIPQLIGSADFSGTLNNLSFHSELTQPSILTVNAKLESLFDSANWQADISAEDVSLQTFFADLPLSLKNVRLIGAGSFSEYSIDGSATFSHKEFGDWNGVWAADKTATQWNVNSLNLTNPLTHTSISAMGTILAGYSFTDTTAVALKADWKNLQWPLQGIPLVSSNKGVLSVNGSLHEYQLDTSGKVVWSEYEISNIDITAQGNREKLQFKKFSADVLQGSVKGSGALTFADEIAWNADTQLTSINLHALYPKLKTKLQSKVKIEGAFKQDKLNSKFALGGLKGTINERPIAGKAQFSIDGPSLKIDNLALRSGKSRLRGSVNYTSADATQAANLIANWDVYLHELKLLTAGLEGSVNSTGSISGAMDKLSGKAMLQASDLKFQEYNAKNIHLDADVDLSEKTRSHIALSVQQADVSGIQLESMQLTVRGTGLKHSIDSKIEQDSNNQLILHALGSWKDKLWNLNLKDTQVRTQQFGNWRQTTPAAVRLSAEDFSIASYCLESERKGKLCSEIEAQKYQKWDGVLVIERLPFAIFKELLPPQFDSANVDLSGQGKFTFSPDTGALLDFKASGENGIITGIKVENKETPIAFNHFDFALSNINKKLESKTSITIEDTGSIALEVSFPNWSELSLPALNEKIQGQVTIDLSNLTVLSIISDYIKDPMGQWHSDIALGGTLEAPILIGESHITASSLTLSTLGLTLLDVDLKAVSNKNRAVIITGSATSGEGKININGTFNDYRATESTGSIKITGENFELARIPEATIIASPDLLLTIQQNSVDLKGDIILTEADFKIFAPTRTITPSPDIVIISAEQPAEKEAPIRLTSKIRIILGKKVKIQGYGLTGRLEGSVLVDDTQALTTASGKINILDGKYVAYGAELDITSGSLTFSGSSIDNPLINVRAERRLSNIIVAGVLIEGEVQAPKISLFSEPAMEDSDILSYIITGQPLSAASEKDGKLLTNAAASLGLLGGEKLAKEIGENFGIDEIKIQTDHTTRDTSLLLGKYLSPDFYVGYAIGIGNAVDTLQIQYKLTEQWVLKTKSGEQQSAEILFTIEKD